MLVATAIPGAITSERSLDPIHNSIVVGWAGVLGGIASGIVMGLFFHHDAWLGGYGSFRRRLLRLGHIAFFGLGFINLLFAFSVRTLPIPTLYAAVASGGFIVGAVTMPIACFLTAWRAQFRHLFPVPVGSVLVGIVALLTGWSSV